MPRMDGIPWDTEKSEKTMGVPFIGHRLPDALRKPFPLPVFPPCLCASVVQLRFSR